MPALHIPIRFRANAARLRMIELLLAALPATRDAVLSRRRGGSRQPPAPAIAAIELELPRGAGLHVWVAALIRVEPIPFLPHELQAIRRVADDRVDAVLRHRGHDFDAV